MITWVNLLIYNSSYEMHMANLLEKDQEEIDSRMRKFSILYVICGLLLVDAFFVRRDGDYIVIGDTRLTTMDLFLLIGFAVALVALLRPMEHKKYQT